MPRDPHPGADDVPEWLRDRPTTGWTSTGARWFTVARRFAVARSSASRYPDSDSISVAPADEDVDTVSANGATMLVRRDRFLSLGGFDETMFLDFEDIDLCWRAWCRGWTSVHVPAATVRHHVGVATRETGALRRRLQSSHHNLLRFAAKCFPRG